MTVITWSEFPEIKVSERRQEPAIVFAEMFLPSNYARIENWLRQNAWKIANIGVLTGAILLATEIHASAASLDDKAKELYKRFISIAKWVIAGKGGWDTINKMLKEDFEGAKKSFLQYLIIFAILIGLPKALEFVEAFFNDVDV